MPKATLHHADMIGDKKPRPAPSYQFEPVYVSVPTRKFPEMDQPSFSSGVRVTVNSCANGMTPLLGPAANTNTGTTTKSRKYRSTHERPLRSWHWTPQMSAAFSTHRRLHRHTTHALNRAYVYCDDVERQSPLLQQQHLSRGQRDSEVGALHCRWDQGDTQINKSIRNFVLEGSVNRGELSPRTRMSTD